jgi:DNA-binding transcriptional regulator PaaX
MLTSHPPAWARGKGGKTPPSSTSIWPVVAQLAELGIMTATAFRATTVPGTGPGGLPQRAWDLDNLQARYHNFIAHTERLRERTLAGQVPPVEALAARTRVMDQWRAFPGLDPDLPGELLPRAWPRGTARELFTTTYDLLGPLAAHRIRQIIARHSPQLAMRATHHSSGPQTAPGKDGAAAPTPPAAEATAATALCAGAPGPA